MTKLKDLSNLPSVWCSQGYHSVPPTEIVRIKSISGKRTRVICKSCLEKRNAQDTTGKCVKPSINHSGLRRVGTK